MTKSQNHNRNNDKLDFIKIKNICSANDTFQKRFLFLDRGEGREKERERNINVWLSLSCPLPAPGPETQPCALTGNQTCDHLIHRTAPNPLSHTSQSTNDTFKKMKRQATCCTEILANHIPHKGFLSRLCTDPSKCKSEKTKKRTKDFSKY